jgi:hypothetical protein
VCGGRSVAGSELQGRGRRSEIREWGEREKEVV